MADRYWVGGTAAWDGTAGTKWSATSGGAGGESVPTTSDDVFFDANSSGTVTISSGNTGAKSINCTGFAGTIAGTSSITVAGSVTLDAGQGYTHTGTMTFNGTGTLVTAGKAFSSVVVNGAGITLTLGDALDLTTNRSLTLTAGTFDTAGYSVNMRTLSSSNSNSRTLNLNASAVTLFLQFNASTSTNLTLNAGTSQINLTGTGSSILASNLTFYDVSFTSTSSGASRSISGSNNTFNNLTVLSPALGLSSLAINADITVNGTFTSSGSAPFGRVLVAGGLATGISFRTITAAAVSADDCDFRAITIAGAAAPISPTRAGDCGSNSGINFPASKTVYRVGTETSWSGVSSWATTSGGTGNDNNFPLAQDTAIIDDNTALTGTLVFNLTHNFSSIDFSARTTGITINLGTSLSLYGDFVLSSAVTVTGSSALTFQGSRSASLVSAGIALTSEISISKASGTLTLGDALSTSNVMSHRDGTFSASSYNVTTSRFREFVTSGTSRSLKMGSGLWTITGTGTGSTSSPWNVSYLSVGSFDAETADILFSSTSTASREFRGSSNLSYNKLTIGGATGTSTTILSGANSFTELASTKSVAHTLQFAANQNTIDTWSITGSAGNVVTVNSSSAGVRRTFTLTNITDGIDYLSVKDIGVSDPDLFYVGSNSIDGGNNLNVIFSAAPGLGTGNFFMLF